MDTHNIKIRYATEEDLQVWFTLDKHLSKVEFYKKVRDKQGLVLTHENEVIGVLRYNLFWDNTPFCNLLYIADVYRQNGYGAKLMQFWEDELRSLGYNLALTSTRSDEDAQHFYRKLGYTDCGNLDFPDQPAELFFIKHIN